MYNHLLFLENFLVTGRPLKIKNTNDYKRFLWDYFMVPNSNKSDKTSTQ